MQDRTKPYIIGETAYIHEGDIGYLLRMVQELAQIGLEAVKFHVLLNPESYYQKGYRAEQATHYTYQGFTNDQRKRADG